MNVQNRDYLRLIAPDAVIADGFDDCIIGVGYRGGGAGAVIVYDRDQIICKLVENDGMTADEAEDHFDYNIAGAYLGEKTPIFAQTNWRLIKQAKRKKRT